MNEETQAQLNVFLQKVLDNGEFALDQAPQLLQEAVMYGRISNSISCALCVAMILLSYRVGGYFCRLHSDAKEEGSYRYDGEWAVFAMGAPWALWCLGFVGLMHDITGLMKSWFAPKLYALQLIAEMVK